MSEVAATFAMYRFIFSCILAVGGIACVFFGYKLFASGAGLAKGADKVSLKSKEFQVSAAGMSVGAVLMLTSAAWAYFSYASVAKLEMAGDLTRITQRAPDSPAANDTTGSTIHPAVGAQVYTASKEPVGKITDVLVDKSAQATGFVVNTGPNGKEVVVSPNSVEFVGSVQGGVTSSAVINMTREQLRNAPALTTGSSGATIHR